MTLRRDPRADPDDEPVAGRIDVFSSERGDSAANAAVSFRRELARLQQQAAAVERSLEEQRRDRSDALERIEQANTLRQEAEQQRELAETELARVRGELEELRDARDAAERAAATHEGELRELRKREQDGNQKASDHEAELRTVRERLDRTTAELSQSREETTRNKAEATRLRQESDAAARKQSELEREHTSARDEIAHLETAIAEARTALEKVPALEAELTAAREATTGARDEITRLEREAEAARQTHDVLSERATMAEREVEDARAKALEQARELENALNATAAAIARAVAADRARVLVEDSVKQLRDEVQGVFARWQPAPPPTQPGGSLAPSAPVGVTMVAATSAGSVRPPIASAPIAPASPVAPVSSGPQTKRASAEPPNEARRSTPPEPDAQPSKPETNASKPPAAPVRASKPPAAPVRASKPAPAVTPSVSPPSSEPALPESLLDDDDDWPADSQPLPASVPPMAASPAVPPSPSPLAEPAAEGDRESSPSMSTFVVREKAPSGIHILSEERDHLIELLSDPATARDAATKLLARAEWLQGRPPIELLIALAHLDYDVESPIFELARSWEREPICRALIASLQDEPDVKLREHGAWLLKHLGAPGAWSFLADVISNESEPVAVRRWLLEAVERLVATKGLGWNDVGDVIGHAVRNKDATLRDGAVTVVAALERSDEKRRLLLDVLRTDDDEGVLASAVQALASALPIELDPAVAERLLGHPSARVQQSVLAFIESSKRTSKS